MLKMWEFHERDFIVDELDFLQPSFFDNHLQADLKKAYEMLEKLQDILDENNVRVVYWYCGCLGNLTYKYEEHFNFAKEIEDIIDTDYQSCMTKQEAFLETCWKLWTRIFLWFHLVRAIKMVVEDLNAQTQTLDGTEKQQERQAKYIDRATNAAKRFKNKAKTRALMNLVELEEYIRQKQ